MKGHNFRKFCLFNFFALFQGQVMTSYYQAVDAHSTLVLHLEILWRKSLFFFFNGNLKIAEKYFSFRKHIHLFRYQANSTPLPLGPLPELFTHRLVQANHLGFVLLHAIWYCMRLELMWIKKCFTVTPLCSVEESWAHSPMRKDYPCLRRRVDKQDTAAWIQGTHRKMCWEDELAASFSLFSYDKMALEQKESNVYKRETGMLQLEIYFMVLND